MKDEADFVKNNPDAAALSARAASLTSVDRKSLAFDSKLDNLQYLKSMFGTLDDDETPDARGAASKEPSKKKKKGVTSASPCAATAG
jgi:hypothetical protein